MYLCSDGSCMNLVVAECSSKNGFRTTPEPSEPVSAPKKRETYEEWSARGGKARVGVAMTCHRPTLRRK